MGARREIMLPNMNLSDVKRSQIKPGGYVLRVLAVEIDAKYNRLQLKVDIADGPDKDYFTDLESRYDFWGLYANLYLDSDEKTRWKFRKSIDAFMASNPDFTWNYDGENDEQTLVGKLIGATCRNRHYIGNDGKEKTKLQVYALFPVNDIKTGNYKIPDDVYADNMQPSAPASAGVVDTTAPDPVPGFGPVQDDDMPF